MKKLRIGIDLGGTLIKGGIIDGDGGILASKSVETEASRGSARVTERIGDLIASLIERLKKQPPDFAGAGIGVPGIVDSEAGVVIYGCNIGFDNVPIADMLHKRFPFKIAVTNDANAAALGETLYGAGRGLKDTVTVTLGTGVGSGIVIGGKLFEGYRGAGAEIGHMSIDPNGRRCACGRNGCFETAASASALIYAAREAARGEKGGAMERAAGNIERINVRTAFDCAAAGDPTASAVVGRYIENLAAGIINIINIFRPQAVIIGGGISYRGEEFLKPLETVVRRGVYGGERGPKTELKIASLRNDAGFIGAACLIEG